jgi:hypothetical protein
MASARKKGIALVFLGVVVLGTGFGILEIHLEQKQERANLHAGVIRDQQLLALKLQQQSTEKQQQDLLQRSARSPPL